MSAVDGRAVHLDLRLVPAALTGWGVTAAGILWSISGVVAVLVVAIAATTAAAWWGSGRRGSRAGVRLPDLTAVPRLRRGLGLPLT